MSVSPSTLASSLTGNKNKKRSLHGHQSVFTSPQRGDRGDLPCDEATKGMRVSEKTLIQVGLHCTNKLALRIEKSIYRIKKVGRLSRELVDAKLFDAGFSQCVLNAPVYFKIHGGELAVVGVYRSDNHFLELKRRGSFFDAVKLLQ